MYPPAPIQKRRLQQPQVITAQREECRGDARVAVEITLTTFLVAGDGGRQLRQLDEGFGLEGGWA